MSVFTHCPMLHLSIHCHQQLESSQSALVLCPPIILHHKGRRIANPRPEGFGGNLRLNKRAMARRVVGAGMVEYLHLAGSEDGYYVEIPRRIMVVEIEIHVRLYERGTRLQDGCRAGDDGLEGEGASFASLRKVAESSLGCHFEEW